jgi:thioredoxin reductase (NADPH)
VEQRNEKDEVIAGPKTGYDFSRDLHRQAEAFGAAFLSGSVNSLQKEGDLFIAGLANGETRKAPAVIIATGSAHRYLNIPGEKEFAGRGVSYCATCDGPFFKNKKIFVVGGGDAACDEAQYLSRLTTQVILIHRRDRFRAQKALAERVMRNPHIEVRFNTIMKEIKGARAAVSTGSVSIGPNVHIGPNVFIENAPAGAPLPVGAVVLERTGSGCKGTGEVYEENAAAVFIFSGTTPQSALVSAGGVKAPLDENGHIITDQKMASSVPGLFAAGDVRSGSFRQVVVAAGEGAVAAHSAAEYLDTLRDTVYS